MESLRRETDTGWLLIGTDAVVSPSGRQSEDSPPFALQEVSCSSLGTFRSSSTRGCAFSPDASHTPVTHHTITFTSGSFAFFFSACRESLCASSTPSSSGPGATASSWR